MNDGLVQGTSAVLSAEVFLTSIVHQDINPSPLFSNLLEHGIDLLAFAHISLDDQGITSHFLDLLGYLLGCASAGSVVDNNLPTI